LLSDGVDEISIQKLQSDVKENKLATEKYHKDNKLNKKASSHSEVETNLREKEIRVLFQIRERDKEYRN